MKPSPTTLLIALCGALLATSIVHAATPLTTVRVATGLNRPIYVTAPPGDDNRLFIVEKAGVIKILDLGSGVLLGTPFLNIDPLVGGGTTNNSEQGLLGLAFHPNYAGNGWFYVNYTNNAGSTVVARYTVSANPNIADPGSATLLLTIAQPQANHNGGWLDFGPHDGYLYIATGDGGGSGDTDAGHTPGVGNSQDITNNLLGKMLRIDVDGDDFPADPNRNYAIPATNPFVGLTGDHEIWSFGLRNPWRPSFDRLTGDLYIADVGQASWEEVNFQPAESPGGENYGWRCREGAHNFNTSGDCSQTPFTEPIHEYARGGNPFRCAITGGYVYRGCAIPDLRGTYFFGDFCSRQVWSFRYAGAFIPVAQDRTAELAPGGGLSIDSIVSFGEDARGELYIVKQGNLANTGEVYRITPGGPTEPPTPYDYDNNGFVEFLDARAFLVCMLGPGVAYADCLCDVFDNGEGAVDLVALRGLQLAYGG
ncbi:MAG: PQQ-dependent sugar dehydrogenase [Phycisphaerales bacterium]|nr:PQQ-dependent sugar dehydrogenase [Phycisphaerales bacterium]